MPASTALVPIKPPHLISRQGQGLGTTSHVVMLDFKNQNQTALFARESEELQHLTPAWFSGSTHGVILLSMHP